MKYSVDGCFMERVAVEYWLDIALDEYWLPADHRVGRVFADECPVDGVATHFVVVGHGSQATTSANAPDGIKGADVDGKWSRHVQALSRDFTNTVKHSVDDSLVERVAIEVELLVALDVDVLLAISSIS